ncbi:hypothetical protein LUZ60_014477 [Juncus effusus]|nr:hypothetical protein LUZ60_014477 [Juncus effusus]
MFKLHRHRSDKSGERIEFKFSNFRAAQVPKGWDKIFLSLVSVDSGKTIAKSNKAHVRNSTCQWSEPISESVLFYQDSNSKEYEECQYKIVVLMGSTRTAILGEISFNLTEYLNSTEPSVISSSLKKCNFSTTLQFNIQCLSTKHKMKDVKSSKEGSSHQEATANNDNKSDGSNTPDEPEIRETSFSASESHCSSNSGDISLSLSPRNPNPNSNGSHMGRQDSFASNTSSVPPTPPVLTSSLTSSLGGGDSAKELLEAAEETIEELRDEAKMWERHSRKVKVEMEGLKKENVEKSKKLEEVQLEISSVSSERDLLRKEVEELKSSLEELRVSNNAPKFDDVSKYDDDVAGLRKELEDEVRFQKEANGNLSLQLKKTQDANEELLDIVKEMETAIEAQKMEMNKIGNKEAEWKRKLAKKDEEIASLKESLSKSVNGLDLSGAKFDTYNNNIGDSDEIEALRAKIQELEKDCAELTEENLDLLYKMKASGKGDGTEISSRDGNVPDEMNEFEIKCAELEIKLQGFMEENETLVKKLGNCEIAIEEMNSELSELREKLEFGNEKLEESKTKINSLTQSKAELEKELELNNSDFEMQINELEHENIHLSERISGLEAQLRYLTNEQESNRVELEDSRSLIQELKEKVVKQQVEVEKAKLDQREKVQETHEKMLLVQEEAEVLRRSNSKIQSTVEGLIEECSSLQNMNSNLRRQKVELHESVTRLELQLEESQKKCTEFSERVDNLEMKLSSLQKDASMKEQSMLSELEKLFEEHKEQEERLNRTQQTLKKLENEKSDEIENLKREIEGLTARDSSNDQNNHENMDLDNIREVNSIRSDMAKLESSLNDANSQIRVYESELETLKKESKNTVQGLIDLLNASKRSEEMLVADVEHMREQMDAKKSNEEKINKKSNELEVKLKSSEYEKQQIMEEISELKSQVQKISQLQEEILGLKGSLDETKFEKAKLEEKFKSVSKENEELEGEKKGLEEKVSSLESRLNNGEDERRNKVVLEAKLVRLQSDLSLKEAAGAVETELKNEISRIKRANSEYQRRIQCLEQEKIELLKKQEEGNNKLTQESGAVQLERSQSDRISALEAELKDMKERYSNMSLQYAEVEAEREELVMKLKSTKTTKGWFS